jgi:formiminotetrahydrofolate cyclodeaminase
MEAFGLAERAAEHGNRNSLSDAGTAVVMAWAAAEAAALSVITNLTSVTDADFRARRQQDVDALLADCRAQGARVMRAIEARLRG